MQIDSDMVVNTFKFKYKGRVINPWMRLREVGIHSKDFVEIEVKLLGGTMIGV